MSLLRRIKVSTVAAALCFLMTGHALPCTSLSIFGPPMGADEYLESQFGKSKSVFRARILRVHTIYRAVPEVKNQKFRFSEAQYDVMEVFKGSPPGSVHSPDIGGGVGSCNLEMQPGREFVFFADQHGKVFRGDSFGYTDPEHGIVKERLAALRQLSQRHSK